MPKLWVEGVAEAARDLQLSLLEQLLGLKARAGDDNGRASGDGACHRKKARREGRM